MAETFEIEFKDVSLPRIDICEFEYWRLRLHYNQSYLGRCLLIAKREIETSIAFCSDEEYKELRMCLRIYENVIGKLFRPDRFNYTQLGNEWNQLHLHLIPRYASVRTWKTYTVEDKRWGQNPTPKGKPPIPIDEVYEIAQILGDKFQSHSIQTVRNPVKP